MKMTALNTPEHFYVAEINNELVGFSYCIQERSAVKTRWAGGRFSGIRRARVPFNFSTGDKTAVRAELTGQIGKDLYVQLIEDLA